MSFIETLREVIFPLFSLLGILLRVLGALGFGAVAGAVLKNVVDREENTKYLFPVVFIVTGLVFVVMGISRDLAGPGLDVGAPGSPGTLGAFGIGATLAYFLLGRDEED